MRWGALAIRGYRLGVGSGRPPGGRPASVQASWTRVAARAPPGPARGRRPRPGGKACSSAWMVRCLTIERQAERMIGQQPGPHHASRRPPAYAGWPRPRGHAGRTTRRPAGAAPAFPPAASRRSSSRSRSPNSWWKRKPGPPGIQGHDETRFASSRSSRIRSESEAAGQQVGQFSVDPVEQAGAQEQVPGRSPGWAVRASRRAGTRRPFGWCRRTPSRTAPGRGGRPGTAPPGAVPRPHPSVRLMAAAPFPGPRNSADAPRR